MAISATSLSTTDRTMRDLPLSSHLPTTIVSTLILLRVNSPMTLCMTPNSFFTIREITYMPLHRIAHSCAHLDNLRHCRQKSPDTGDTHIQTARNDNSRAETTPLIRFYSNIIVQNERNEQMSRSYRPA